MNFVFMCFILSSCYNLSCLLEENRKVARLPHTISSHVQSIRLPVTKLTFTFFGEDHNQSRLFAGRSYYPRQKRLSQVTRIRELFVRELITNLCGVRPLY
ncbi:hypothetical protein L6452_11009 [Arctium lappa]|uniref:Uncharacterized protein n=1 Tax=Arctium lappa TaxID=4217 RepID=A0ACB9DN61_ARCLA|nr:hypothetical protein L6452_11009 [Arctium lappa]